MEAIRLHQTVVRDGEVRVMGLPCRKGQEVEMIVLIGAGSGPAREKLTAADLRRSGLVGLWKNRRGSSAQLARRLRDRAQRRHG